MTTPPFRTAGPPPLRGGTAEGRTKARKSGGPHDGGGRRPAGGGQKGTGEKQTRGTPPKQATGAGGRHRRTPMAAGERQGAAPSPARGRGLAQALAPPAIMGEAGGGRAYPPRPFGRGAAGGPGSGARPEGPELPPGASAASGGPSDLQPFPAPPQPFPFGRLRLAPPFPSGKGGGGELGEESGPAQRARLPAEPRPARRARAHSSR